MKRKPSPPVKELLAPWQIAQAAKCGCRGTDDMCPCQNVDQSEAARRPAFPDREAVAREAWQNLLEKDDRTSPVEYPEMCLITFEEARDLIALSPAQAEREGWVLVPKEPTADMVSVAIAYWDETDDFGPEEEFPGIYRAMLSAVPKEGER